MKARPVPPTDAGVQNRQLFDLAEEPSTKEMVPPWELTKPDRGWKS